MSINEPKVLCAARHDPKNFFFCQSCALHKKPMLQVFYCEGCRPEFKKDHQGHTKVSMKNDQFVKNYKKFKENIKTNVLLAFSKKYKEIKGQASKEQCMRFFKDNVASANQDLKTVLIDSDVDKQLATEFGDQKYRQWLVSKKFWDDKSSNAPQLKSELDKFIITILTQKIGPVASQVNPWAFAIELNKAAGAGALEYREQVDKIAVQVDELNRQKHLGALYLRLTSYFSDEQIEQGLREIEEEGQKFRQMPFLLYMAKLKILELHSAGAQMMKQILADKNFPKKKKKQQELHFYFLALSEWEIVDSDLSQSSSGDQLLFFEARNRHYYRISNPNNYIKALDSAIQIEPRPLYYASRALGYMIEGKYELAESDFNEAERQRFKSDAMLNNRLFNNIKRKKEIDRSTLKESINERATQYIYNICNYLKGLKDYALMKVCCQVLVDREPKNVAFRFRKFEVAFKLRDKDAAKEELAFLKNLNQLEDNELLECERKIELLKAQENERLGNYSDAESKYQRVAEMGEEVATYWYNYAAFLFNHREQEEKNEKALMAINKAIDIEPKKQYLKLKYMLLFLCGSMEEAKRMHETEAFLGLEFKDVKQFIEDNL